MRSVRWILATSVSLIAWLPGQAVWAQQADSPVTQAMTPIQTVAPTQATATTPTVSPTQGLATTTAQPGADTPTPSTPAAQTADTANGLGQAVSSTQLDTYRGGSQTFNDMQVNGTLSDTRALGVQTGSNAIADGSFANASGLPTVIQNTGNNVLIQNATIVNVQFKQ